MSYTEAVVTPVHLLDPTVLGALLIQLLAPAGLLAFVAFRRGHDPLRLGLDAGFVALYVVAIALAGLWLALPRWLVVAYGLLLAPALWMAARRQGVETVGPGPTARGGRRRVPWVRMLGLGCAAAVVAVALAGRRPLEGPAVALAAPLTGGVYRVAAGGSTALVNPHLGTLEGERFRPWRGQSYGVDLVGVGNWGSRRSPSLATGLEGFAIFGDAIRAPCAGSVVRAVDGRPDILPPGEAPAALEGNHVILECGGRWVVLAHMERGSVAVAVGDTVGVGSPLGRVGNSGNSDEPHLHIHAQTPGTDDEPLSGDPLPLTFDGRQPVRNDLVPGSALGADGAVVGRFQAELDRLRDDLGFPGATAAWMAVDGRSGEAAAGVADLETGRPMPPDARMLAASIGKTFVAAAVVALAGEGTLALDAPVAGWLGGRPWFSRLAHGPSITIRHLLTHTSGLPDHVYDPAFRERWAVALGQPDAPPPPPDSLVMFVLDDPPLFRPGEGWAYTDTGYLLLGMVVEEASGRSVFDEIEARFLGPLGLSRTEASSRRELPGLVPGYVVEGNDYGLPVRTMSDDGTLVWNPAVEGAGGGLVSHPADLVRWARALYHGNALRGADLDELLTTVPVDGAAGGLRYGAGVSIRPDGPLGPVWGHAGSIPGYLSSMRYYPDHGIAVAFQVDTDGRFAAGVDPGEALKAMELRLARAAVGGAAGAGPDGPDAQPGSGS